MSDVHGHYGKFLDMMNKIQFSDDDHLYIIGDVIDKGEDAGNLFLTVSNDSRVTCMLGNHELMMMDSVKSQDDMYLWFRNGAANTIDQFAAVGLEYQDLITVVEQWPVIIPRLQVGDTNFYLVHAAPYTEKIEDTKHFWDMDYDSIFHCLWDRQYGESTRADFHALYDMYPNTFFLIGHTPVYYSSYERYNALGAPMMALHPDKKIINLDCGCAGNRRLGCLRLEDFQEFYI